MGDRDVRRKSLAVVAVSLALLLSSACGLFSAPRRAPDHPTAKAPPRVVVEPAPSDDAPTGR